MYLPVVTLRHWEPYRKSEFTGDVETDGLKVIVAGGLWHLGSRYASKGNTELTMTDDSTEAIYALYNKSSVDSITIDKASLATVYGYMSGTSGYLYQLLGVVTTVDGEITLISESWEGGDLLTADNTFDLDMLSLNFDTDPTHINSYGKAELYGYEYGNPTTSTPIVPGDKLPVAPGTDNSNLLWKTFPTIESTASDLQTYWTTNQYWAVYNHNHDGVYSVIDHSWYVTGHTDGPPVEHDANTYLKWNGSSLVWAEVTSGAANHYDLTDIASHDNVANDHGAYFQNGRAITGAYTGETVGADYTNNYCSTIGDSNADQYVIDLDNRDLGKGKWTVNVGNANVVTLGDDAGSCATFTHSGGGQVEILPPDLAHGGAFGVWSQGAMIGTNYAYAVEAGGIVYQGMTDVSGDYCLTHKISGALLPVKVIGGILCAI